MKKEALIVNGIVTQVQPSAGSKGFVEVPSDTVCGMVDNFNGTFSIQSKTQAELQQEVFNHFDTLTRQFINDAVLAFDTANNTTFKNIEAFTKYLHNTNDVRYPIAVSFLTWQSAVWDKVIIQRDLYLSSQSMPTDEAFLIELAKVVR